MGDFIKQLTGVRFVAAAWVMLYHFQPSLAAAGILVPVLHEVLRLGSVGVTSSSPCPASSSPIPTSPGSARNSRGRAA